MTTPESTFPPAADPALAPFWEGMRSGTIVLQCCEACGSMRWPPRSRCPECLSEEIDWREAAPGGRLISFATYHRAMNAETAGIVPYTVAYVEMDSGPRVYGRLLPDAGGARCDDRVSATTHEIEPGLPYIGWQLAPA